MEVTDDKLVAYLDGELSTSERLKLDELILVDSDLQARLNEFREADLWLVHAYEDIEKVPMRPEILQMLSDTEEAGVARTRSYKTQNELRRPVLLSLLSQYLSRPVWASATVATCALLLGILVGSQLDLVPGSTSQLQMAAAGIISRDHPLHQVLENNLSSEASLIDGGQNVIAMPVLTFRSTDRRYCREFTVSATQLSSRGIACREDGTWNMEMLVRDDTILPDDGQFTTASSTASAVLDDLFNSLAIGEPMDSASEASLITSTWTAE